MKVLLTIGIIALAFITCTKQSAPKPAVLNSYNSFGCNVNGISLVPCVAGSANSTEALSTKFTELNTTHASLTIIAQNHCDDNFKIGRYFTIRFDSVVLKKDSTYKLSDFSENARSTVACEYSEDLYYYSSDSLLTGSLVIESLDLGKRAISGSLQATLKRVQDEQKIQVTLCTFNLRY